MTHYRKMFNTCIGYLTFTISFIDLLAAVEDSTCKILYEQTLHQAVYYDNLDAVKCFLWEKKFKDDLESVELKKAFFWAAEYGQVDIINYFFQQGISIAHVRRDDDTILHVATFEGHKRAVESILSHSAINVDLPNNQTNTALHIAAHDGQLDIIKLLITDGHANPHLTNKYNQTILHSAILGGYLKNIDYLINDLRVNVDAQDINGDTALHLACEFGKLHIVKNLIENANATVTITDNMGNSPLDKAAYNGHLAIVSYLAENFYYLTLHEDQELHTPLHWAVMNGQLNTVKYLVQIADMDIFKQNIYGSSPVEFSIYYNHAEILSYFIESNQDWLQIILIILPLSKIYP